MYYTSPGGISFFSNPILKIWQMLKSKLSAPLVILAKAVSEFGYGYGYCDNAEIQEDSDLAISDTALLS